MYELIKVNTNRVGTDFLSKSHHAVGIVLEGAVLAADPMIRQAHDKAGT